MGKTAILVLTIISVVSVIEGTPREKTAEKSRKAVTDWTIEERLAERFDRAQISARNIAYADEMARTGRVIASTATGVSENKRWSMTYVIDGRRDPELFLPHELFDALMTGLQPDESVRVKQRNYYKDVLRRAGYDGEKFWADLESVSAAYLPLRYRTGQPASVELVKAEAMALCSERYNALEAARRLFGRREFDIVLYTVIAPSLQFSETTLDPELGAKYRRAEKGCR